MHNNDVITKTSSGSVWKCAVLSHDWGRYTQPVNTGNHIFIAQFRSCKRCNRVTVKYIKLMHYSSVCEVRAEKANEFLEKS